MGKELCLLALTYFIPIYTDFVHDPKIRYDCGFVMTMIFLSVVVVNLCLVLIDFVNKLRLSIKYCLFNKAGKKGKEIIIEYEKRKTLRRQKTRKVRNESD